MRSLLAKIQQIDKRDAIAIGIAVLLSLVIYGEYIATPFGDYDTWFERIAYGNYEFKELPKPLQKLNIPTDLHEYIKYRERVVGRLFGSVLPTFVLMSLFGHWALGWRIVLFLLMFASYWLLYSIMKKISMPYWHRIIAMLFFVILLNRYFFKPISIIIGLSHFFFLLSLWLELNNGGRKGYCLKRSLWGALFVFLSLFLRELSAVSITAVLVVLLFWHDENGRVDIHFQWNWKRLLPYSLAAAVYSALYLKMSLYKVEYAYSNLISWRIDLAYVKEIFLLLLKWLGLDTSSYLGLFLTLIVGFMFILALAKAGYLPEKTETFRLVFGILLLVPALLLIPFLRHGTGSFTIQYLACMIILSFLIGYMENAGLDYLLKKVSRVVLGVVLGALWIVFALEARQKAENFCMDAHVTAKAIEISAMELPQNGTVELAGFSVTSAYSFIADLFISGRRDIVEYKMKTNPYIDRSEKYLEYLIAGFADQDHKCSEPALLIKKWCLPVGAQEVWQTNTTFDRITKWTVRKYSVGYMMSEIIDRNYNKKHKKYGFWNNLCSKMLFSVRPDTLKNQLLNEIGFGITQKKSYRLLD